MDGSALTRDVLHAHALLHGAPILVRGAQALPAVWRRANWSVPHLVARLGHVSLPLEPFPYAGSTAAPVRDAYAHAAPLAALISPDGPHSIFACPRTPRAEPPSVFLPLRGAAGGAADGAAAQPPPPPSPPPPHAKSAAAANLPAALRRASAGAVPGGDGAAARAAAAAALLAEWAAPPYLVEDAPAEAGGGGPPPLRTAAVQFYLGGVGSGTQPHWHTASWNALLRGRKRWLLWPPSRASYAHRHVARSARAARDAAGAPLVCEQRAGDVLLVPPLWGHATVNLRPVLGFATELRATERAGGHEGMVDALKVG